jgi:hypothetical protein
MIDNLLFLLGPCNLLLPVLVLLQTIVQLVLLAAPCTVEQCHVHGAVEFYEYANSAVLVSSLHWFYGSTGYWLQYSKLRTPCACYCSATMML